MSNTPPNCPTPAGRRNQWLFVLLSASPDAAARTIHTNRAQRLNAVPKRLCKSNSPKPCSFHRVLACTLPASWMASWEHSLWRAGNDETPFCRSYKGVDWSTGLYASSRHRLGDGVTVWTCSRLTLACEKVTPKGSTDDVGGVKGRGPPSAPIKRPPRREGVAKVAETAMLLHAREVWNGSPAQTQREKQKCFSFFTRAHFWCEPYPASLNDSSPARAVHRLKGDVGRGGEDEVGQAQGPLSLGKGRSMYELSTEP